MFSCPTGKPMDADSSTAPKIYPQRKTEAPQNTVTQKAERRRLKRHEDFSSSWKRLIESLPSGGETSTKSLLSSRTPACGGETSSEDVLDPHLQHAGQVGGDALQQQAVGSGPGALLASHVAVALAH